MKTQSPGVSRRTSKRQFLKWFMKHPEAEKLPTPEELSHKSRSGYTSTPVKKRQRRARIRAKIAAKSRRRNHG